MDTLYRVSPALFLALALSGCVESMSPAPPTLEIVSGDAQTGPIFLWPADSLVVRATDSDGNPLVAWPVEWTAAERSGSIKPDTVLTDTAGIARMQWVLGPKAGEQRVSASVQGSNAVTFHAQADPGKVFVGVWRFREGQQPWVLPADTIRVHVVDPEEIEQTRRELREGISLNVGGPVIWGSGVDPVWPFHFDPRLAGAFPAASPRSLGCTGQPARTKEEADSRGYTSWGYCPFQLYLVRIDDVPAEYLAQLDSL